MIELRGAKYSSTGLVGFLGILALITSLGLWSPAEAHSTKVKLSFKAEKMVAPAGKRKARVTMTNKGPDVFGCFDPYCNEGSFVKNDPFGKRKPNDNHKAFGSLSLSVSHQKRTKDFAEAYPGKIETSRDCTPARESFKNYKRHYCYFGTGRGAWLGVGKSISMIVTFPASSNAYRSDSLGAAFEGSYTGNTDIPIGPDSYGAILWGNECDLTADRTQKASSGKLVVSVKAIDAGCTAKLTAAKVKIGNSVYSFVKALPSRKLKVGQSWKVSIPLGKDLTRQVRKAVGGKAKVLGKAEFKLDGSNRSVEVEFSR